MKLLKLSKALFLAAFLIVPQLAHALVEVNAIKGLDAPAKPYASVMLRFDGPLKQKKEFEKKMRKALAKSTTTRLAVETEALPPIEEYTEEQERSHLLRQGIEAVLTATLIDAESRYTVTEVPYTIHREHRHKGKIHHEHIHTTRTEVDRRDFYSHRIVLTDVASGREVWVAESESSAGTWTQDWTRNSIVKKTAKQLLESGLLLKKAKKP